MSHPRTTRPGLARLVHTLRVAVIVALLLLIPPPSTQSRSDTGSPPSIGVIKTVLPAAKSLDVFYEHSERWTVQNEIDQPIGSVVRTLPAAKDVVGYRGPTESAIIFDLDLKIAGVRMLHSADTEEHVDAVRADESFFAQFKGWPWGGPSPTTQIDGVSGATLTSLALAEGVLKRIDGNLSSLLFPSPLSIDEIDDWYPDAQAIDESKTVAIVTDRTGREIGRVMRTGTLADGITGYRGPTELLLKLDRRDYVQEIKIRSSYDNQPFTGYVRDEPGFWRTFEDKALDELAGFRPEQAGVEGVSGATMTGLAVADTIVAAAKQAEINLDAELAKANRPARILGMRWTSADIATGILLLLAGLVRRFHWFRHRRFRKIWLGVIVSVIGFWGGNLVSLALIAGWSAEGIAWQLAPGLAAIALLALIGPPISGGNPYCNHLCPHGALQQLIKPSRNARWRIHPPRKFIPWLRRIPWLTLVAAYVTLILVPTTDLSTWEPFLAYLMRIAGWGSIALAFATLIFAALIPMGYCRFGCPTGSLLTYLRSSVASSRLKLGDLIAVGLLVLALTVRCA